MQTRGQELPAQKSRKVDATEYEPRNNTEHEEREQQGVEEKRRLEDPEEAPPSKRLNTRTNKDIREMFSNKQEAKPVEQEQEEEVTRTEKPPPPTVQYGQEEEHELAN